MGVTDTPAGDDDLTDVGFVIAVRVLEEHEVRRLRDDHSAVGEDEARRDVEMVREHRELVGLAVAVGVFADLDAIVALLLVFLHAMRVVGGFADPEATAGIPGESDGLHDVWLSGEQHQLHVGGHLRSLHAAFDRERLLEGQRLGALLVVGHVAVLLTDLGFALGEESLPSGLAGGGERTIKPGANGFRSRIGLHDEHREPVTGKSRLHDDGVVTFELGALGRLTCYVVEPDRITTEGGHQRVQRADGGLLLAVGVQIQDADRSTGGRRGGEDGEENREESDEVAHRGTAKDKPVV